jgi:hypothetical protein
MSFAGAGAATGAVGDLFSGFMGAMGDMAASKAYDQAAAFANENAAVAKRSGVVQEAQLNRNIYQVVSGQGSAEAASGLQANSGSGQYLQRASLQQGGLAKAIVANNTQLQVQGYEAEAAADIGQATQAQDQGIASAGSGILGAFGSMMGI